MFWGFLRNSWKFGSLLKNPVLCYRCRTMLKIPWNTKKTPPKHVLILNYLLAMVRCLGQPTVRNILLERSNISFIESNLKLEVVAISWSYLFWIGNIPQDISCDTRDVLVQYIDSVIKTDIPDESDVELCQLVKRLQTHSHSKYFQKTPASSGRFRFPFVLQII